MKSQDEVITEFNELVNMTARELEKWLKSGDSNSAGWPKEDESDETVGHDSGRRIVEILKANPKKDPEEYTKDQIKHMRKVVSYCKRHLAQEAKSNADKPPEELKKTKSYASLKNWGHDPLHDREESSEASSAEEEAQTEEENQGEEETRTGGKRKLSQSRSGSNKKRETRQGRSSSKENGDSGSEKPAKNRATKNEQKNSTENKDDVDGQDVDSSDDEYDADTTEEEKEEETPQTPTPKRGDTVSWNWGNGQPKGKVLDVKDKKATIKTKNGNSVSRDGTAEDPAVILDAGKSKAIKLNHELNGVE